MKADYVLLLAHFTLRGGTDLHTYIPTHTHTHTRTLSFSSPTLLRCYLFISSGLKLVLLAPGAAARAAIRLRLTPTYCPKQVTSGQPLRDCNFNGAVRS